MDEFAIERSPVIRRFRGHCLSAIARSSIGSERYCRFITKANCIVIKVQRLFEDIYGHCSFHGSTAP